MSKMSETDWAIRNLELAGYLKGGSDYDGMLGNAVKNLLLCHQKEGHSGVSHVMALNLFKKVALGEALTLEFWNERFNEMNELAKENDCKPFSEEKYEKLICKKPRSASGKK